jgi:hypothetical protein
VREEKGAPLSSKCRIPIPVSLFRRQGVDIGDAQAKQLLVRIPVIRGGSPIGIDDGSLGGVNQKDDGTVRLEKLAEDPVTSRSVFGNILRSIRSSGRPSGYSFRLPFRIFVE